MQQSARDQTTPAPEQRPLPIWLRGLSRLPFGFWYGVADFLAWLAEHVVFYRRRIIDAQLQLCFPAMNKAELRRTRIAFYRNFADVLVEIIKSPSLSRDELRARVEIEGMEHARRFLDAGQPVLLVASHIGNWEWMLMALAIELGYPFDAAYKPLHNAWADRIFLTLRSRFGSRLVPAKQLFTDVVQRRTELRGIGMVADQDPVSAELRHFTQFLGQQTAFYMGAEAIARAARLPVVFVGMHRIERGRYRLTLEPLAEQDERLPPGGIIERYVQRVEALIIAQPADWLWAYRRWKVKQSVYGASTLP